MSKFLRTFTEFLTTSFIESTRVAYNRYAMCPAGRFRGNFWDLMFLLDFDYYYYIWYFTCAHIQIFYSSIPFNNRFGYCIQLYTWSTQQVIGAQHMYVVRSSMKVPEIDKHLKKAGGHIGRNIVEITIKMKTIVRKPLIIFFSFKSFSHQRQLIVFQQSFSDSKSLQVSRTLLGILADLNNAVVWTVSTRNLIL